MTHKITLQDGTVLDNLELNGNNFIPETSIDTDIFKESLNMVTIADNEGNIEELNNFKVIFTKVGERQSFVLTEKTQEELEKENLLQLMADLTEVVLLGGV